MKTDFRQVLQEVYNIELDDIILEVQHIEGKVKDEEVFFIENQKAGMLIRKSKQEWTTVQGFCKHYGIMNEKEFLEALRGFDRVRTRVVNTFKYHNENDELNLMSKDDWIDEKYIVAGELNELTYCVLQSLSGGDEKALEHIMKWIGWKYKHPEDFMLPALSIYGAQNVGKGVFTNRILPTIFGDRQVFHAHGDDITGSFNSHSVIGRSIVCVDESNLSKKTDDRLKQLIGNPKVVAHPKGLTPFEIDNCIAYVFTSNDLFGGMKLDSDVDSNRRFSMIKVTKSLPDWVAQWGLDWNELLRKDEITKNFSDPVEIGKLLHACIEMADERPVAYHGEDYKEIIEVQHPINDFFEDVFSNFPTCGVVPTSEIYEQYVEWKDSTDPSGWTMSQTKLTQEAKKWAQKRMPDLDYKPVALHGKTTRCFIVA